MSTCELKIPVTSEMPTTVTCYHGTYTIVIGENGTDACIRFSTSNVNIARLFLSGKPITIEITAKGDIPEVIGTSGDSGEQLTIYDDNGVDVRKSLWESSAPTFKESVAGASGPVDLGWGDYPGALPEKSVENVPPTNTAPKTRAVEIEDDLPMPKPTPPVKKPRKPQTRRPRTK